jgi:hypothetical protein
VFDIEKSALAYAERTPIQARKKPARTLR